MRLFAKFRLTEQLMHKNLSLNHLSFLITINFCKKYRVGQIFNLFGLRDCIHNIRWLYIYCYMNRKLEDYLVQRFYMNWTLGFLELKVYFVLVKDRIILKIISSNTLNGDSYISIVMKFPSNAPFSGLIC